MLLRQELPDSANKNSLSTWIWISDRQQIFFNISMSQILHTYLWDILMLYAISYIKIIRIFYEKMIVYLKFKYNCVFYILSGNPTWEWFSDSTDTRAGLSQGKQHIF